MFVEILFFITKRYTRLSESFIYRWYEFFLFRVLGVSCGRYAFNDNDFDGESYVIFIYKSDEGSNKICNLLHSRFYLTYCMDIFLLQII